jgi:hypothetical protein
MAEVRWNFTVVALDPQTPIMNDEPSGDSNLNFWSTITGLAIGIIMAVILIIDYMGKR